MKILECPSCGGKLEIPDNLEMTHCIYCRTKIRLTETDLPKDKLKLSNYSDMFISSYSAQNFQDALYYCNKILEIDSKSIEAWINKAQCTFFLSTWEINRYNEAISYLDRAFQINPNDERVSLVKKELLKLQVSWLCNLARYTFEDVHRL